MSSSPRCVANSFELESSLTKRTFEQVSNLAINNISWKYYLVFICLNAIDFVIIAAFFPETQGKTLEQMAEVFGDEVDAQDVLDKAAGHEKLEHHELDVEKS